MTRRERVDAIGAALGRLLRVEELTREQARRHLPPALADGLLDLWESATGVPADVTTAVEEITGHPARTFGQWADDHVADVA